MDTTEYSTTDDTTEKSTSIEESTSNITIDKNIGCVIYEDINDKYSRGKLGPLDVVIMKENGYINATKLCAQANKCSKKWFKNRESKNIVNAVKDAINDDDNDIIIKIINGKKEIKCTYVHFDLIVHIASWCNATFAVLISKIVRQYFIEKVSRDKDDKINKMHHNIKKLLKDNKRLLKDNEEFKRRDDIMSDKICDIAENLDTLADNYVVDGKSGDRHILSVVKTNQKQNRKNCKKNREILYDYVVMRVMKKCYKQRCKELREKYPNMEILSKIKYTPNSMNLWNRVRHEMGNKITINGCRFNLKIGYTQRRMLRDINKIHDKRFDHE